MRFITIEGSRIKKKHHIMNLKIKIIGENVSTLPEEQLWHRQPPWMELSTNSIADGSHFVYEYLAAILFLKCWQPFCF